MKEVDLSTLPTSKAFFPTTDRGWFVHFWDISIGDVFIAIPFAILLTILFYFDHNGKSLVVFSHPVIAATLEDIIGSDANKSKSPP